MIPTEQLGDGPLADAVRAIYQRIDELELFTFDLADEMGSKMADTREFLHHRKIVERLIVEAFELGDAERLYWRGGHGGPRLRPGPLTTTDPMQQERVAQLLLYYLLFMHCSQASFRELERAYGYSRYMFPEKFSRLDATPTFHAQRVAIERRYLDAIGRPDEPISEFDSDALRAIAELKGWCKIAGRDYRLSLLYEHSHPAAA